MKIQRRNLRDSLSLYRHGDRLFRIERFTAPTGFLLEEAYYQKRGARGALKIRKSAQTPRWRKLSTHEDKSKAEQGIREQCGMAEIEDIE